MTVPPLADADSSQVHYRITGSAAHARLSRLLPAHWRDCTMDSNVTHLELLWENAPRHETRAWRDGVRCYSHLPNGTAILDSKWVLARLMAEDGLETHCFRGPLGFADLAHRLGWQYETNETPFDVQTLPDITRPETLLHPNSLDRPPNLWIVKDAAANGAGGIWVVGPSNADVLADRTTSPLLADHRYVAQKYAWPLVLYDGRKCHARVYGLVTGDGRAFVHQRAFLHVANDRFTTEDGRTHGEFMDSIHITNCCANSHDSDRFAGEICADLAAKEWSKGATGLPMVPLQPFAASIESTVATLARRAFSYLQGGRGNNGFEYLGMDFILSVDQSGEQPVAHLLEVNAPPSQDTATGLPHAEELHDCVMRDICTLWIIPSVTGAKEEAGGWHCVYRETRPELLDHDRLAVPSKAAMLNKMKWALFERKISKNEPNMRPASMAAYARTMFPFFDGPRTVFFENAGGAQVPRMVIEQVSQSLANRHRSSIGATSRESARYVLSLLLGASLDLYAIHLGANASSLLATLAIFYVRAGKLHKGDEIVMSTENHLANVYPWLEAAEMVDAEVIWWDGRQPLSSLLNDRTRIVALAHASNILGQVRDIASLTKLVRVRAPRAHIVVDGVAAAPHLWGNVDTLDVDWYAVSCHKLFGPHLGVLCGRRATLANWNTFPAVSSSLEVGTVSYEACAGIIGLGAYFAQMGRQAGGFKDCRLTRSLVQAAYQAFAATEATLTADLLTALQRSPKVRVLSGPQQLPSLSRLPVVSIVHDDIRAPALVEACAKRSIVCRHGTFLSCEPLQSEYHIDADGVVRFSLAHYNTRDEVALLMNVLEALPGWF